MIPVGLKLFHFHLLFPKLTSLRCLLASSKFNLFSVPSSFSRSEGYFQFLNFILSVFRSCHQNLGCFHHMNSGEALQFLELEGNWLKDQIGHREHFISRKG